MSEKWTATQFREWCDERLFLWHYPQDGEDAAAPCTDIIRCESLSAEQRIAELEAKNKELLEEDDRKVHEIRRLDEQIQGLEAELERVKGVNKELMNGAFQAGEMIVEVGKKLKQTEQDRDELLGALKNCDWIAHNDVSEEGWCSAHRIRESTTVIARVEGRKEEPAD